MKIKQTVSVLTAMRLLDISSPTIYSWLDGDRFPGAFQSGKRNEWSIPIEAIEKVRSEEIEKLQSKMDNLLSLGIK